MLLAVVLAALAGGCGNEEGAASGAIVTAYVAQPLCPEAEQQLSREGTDAGDLQLQVTCLAKQQAGDRIDLATVGANARRATEDSASIAYVETRSRASRFSQPIIEESGIPFLRASSGSIATSKVLEAVSEADPSALRDSVREALE